MKFPLPELGEGVQESELVKWHVHEGETLAQDQKIAEFMTDKAAIEVPYPHAGGKILRLLVNEGDTVKIGMTNDSAPMLFTSDGPIQYIVMPMFVQWESN